MPVIPFQFASRHSIIGNQIEEWTDSDISIRPLTQEIALEFPKYGYRRITAELKRRKVHVNHKRVIRIMKEDNLICVKKSFKPITTNSNHGHKVYPNLI